MLAAAGAAADAAADAPPAATTGRMLQQLAVEKNDWILRADALQFLATHAVAEAAGPIRELLADTGENPWLRGRALVALAKLDAATDLAPFVAHEDPKLRAAAAESLETSGGDAAAAMLAGLVKDEVPEVRLRALASQARQLGENAWPAVDAATLEVSPDVLETAARALAFTGNEPALARLAEFALNAENAAHLPRIIRGIRDVPNPNLIPVFLRILAADEASYAAIVSALQPRDQEQLIAALDKELARRDPAATRTVAKVIAALVQVPELGNSLRRALEDVVDTDTILVGLVALGSTPMEPDRHRELFAKYLKHDEVSIRALAIRCLAHCKEANLFDEFRASVADPEPAVVHAVLAALLRAPVATAPRGQMVDYLQEPLVGKDEVAREMAYQLLGQAGGAEDFRPAMAMLGHLLRGKDAELREAAATALGKIAPKDAVGEVVRAQGYLAKWRVLGTFFNDEKNSGFDQVLPPEEDEEIDFKATYLSEYVWVIEHQTIKADQEKIAREITWTDASLDKTNGKLVMSAQLPPPGSYSVGFAVVDFEADADRDAVLSISGDDAFRVWLNGEKIAEAVAEYTRRQACVAERSGIAVKLQAGPNRLLIKSANIDHEWWLRVRVTDKDGDPIALMTP